MPADAPPIETAHLDGLDQRFLAALAARRKGDLDSCAELLRGVLKVEPRLAEPHMELASLLLETEQVVEALEHAEAAVRLLESGEPWTDDLPPHVIRSLAWNLLAEALRRRADSDEVVFGDPAVFEQLMGRAKSAFGKAAALDPDNAHADHWGFALGVRPEGEE